MVRVSCFILCTLLALGLTCSTALLLERQNLRDSMALDLNQLVRKELSGFLSSYLWQKVDVYGHFGKWIEEEQGGNTSYLSIFKDQKEFVPLTRASVSLDSSFLGRVAVIANTMAVSLGKEEDALVLLKATIIEQAQHKAIFRLYGEVGLIEYQVRKNCNVALRYLEKSMELSQRMKNDDYSSDDLFNRRFYGLAGAMCSFNQGDIPTAFRFHEWSFFEPGSEEFEAVMRPLREQIPVHLRPKPPQPRPSGSDHIHDEFCNHGPEQSAARPDSIEKALEKQAQEAREHFVYLIPSIHPIFFAIEWQTIKILFILFILQIVYLIWTRDKI